MNDLDWAVPRGDLHPHDMYSTLVLSVQHHSTVIGRGEVLVGPER